MHPPSEADSDATFLQQLTKTLRHYGVETHGLVALFLIAPTSKEDRVDTRSYQHFLLWFSANLNLITMVVGAGGPVVFELSFLNTAMTLLISDIVAIFGPKLGTRAMVQALYSVMVPSLLNILNMLAYVVFGLILGGQVLATVSSHLTPTTGIVIVGLISLVACFCGYRTLHWFVGVSWLPTLLVLLIMLGIGGRHLSAALSSSYPAPSASSILSFSSAVMASVLGWCTVTADYGVYHDANAPSALVFTYVYLGIFLPSIMMHLLGAAFAAAAAGVPAWNAGYDGGNNFGGLASAVLQPSGAFGKILMVLMSLVLSAPTALEMYSSGMSLMNVSSWFAKVPRYVFAIVATAVCIPVAVVGQTRFYTVLVIILDLIGYWCASYAGIIFTEHVIFRRGNLALYKLDDWADGSRLPPGIAALLAFLGSFALIVPCMAQTFYTGPIAKTGTGDIGLLVGFFGTCVLYAALRPIEKRLFPGHSS
ncbi:cytosine-purine permease [Mycena pura]|uniref:Cytosine-purine permease n=1 Tax=Mycena pura TaxID=153505 RepID=A0AAD6Y3E1_9AGAR|nr:cytosine-purine permease [Mycena pura]